MNRVSIIMPAYNAEGFITDAIDSVIAQTFVDWELLIVDDGSTDGTKEVINAYIHKDPRIRYYHQANGKQGKARNLGIINSTGDYIAFLDADDYWIRTKLETQIAVFEKYCHVALVCTNGYSFETEREDVRSTWCSLSAGIIGPEQGLHSMLRSNFILNSSVVLRRSVFEKVDYFSEYDKVQAAEDYDLWVRLLENDFSFYFVDESLTAYRKHPMQSTTRDGYASLAVLHVLKDRKYVNKSLEKEKVLAAKFYFSRAVRKNLHLERQEIRNLIILYTNITRNKVLKTFYLTLFFLFGKRLFASLIYRLSVSGIGLLGVGVLQ